MIASQYWLWTHVLFVLSLLCGVLRLIALMGYTLRNSRVSGLAGISLLFAVLLLIFGPNYYETFVNPVVAM